MVEHFSGFQIDQAETEFLGATAEAVDQARAVKLIVGGGAGGRGKPSRRPGHGKPVWRVCGRWR